MQQEAGATGVFFDHIHIKSDDPAASAGFYTAAFGAKELSREEVKGRLRIVLEISALRFFIEQALSDSGDGATVPFRGLEHFGLRVADLDHSVSRLRALGARFLVEPRQSRPGIRIAFVIGPDGEAIELIERGGA